MSAPRCVVAEPIAESGLALLRAACDVVEAEPGADLRALLADAEALVVRSATRVDADLIAAAPRLRVIGRAGVGVDNVDVDAATTAGIVVCNAPEANVVSAAEHALALLLALARHISAAERSLRDGAWERERFAGIELADKTLALLGFGRIGRLVASRARALGMRTVAYDPYVTAERIAELGAEQAPTIEAALEVADVVSLHLPVTPATRGLIDATRLAPACGPARCSSTPRAARSSTRPRSSTRCAPGSSRARRSTSSPRSRCRPTRRCAMRPTCCSRRISRARRARRRTAPASSSPSRSWPRSAARPSRTRSTSRSCPRTSAARSSRSCPWPSASAGSRWRSRRGPSRASRSRRPAASPSTGSRLLTSAALRGAFGAVHESLNDVNALSIAAELGVEVAEQHRSGASDYTNLLAVTVRDPQERTVVGTVLGADHEAWLVRVHGLPLEIELAGRLLLLRNDDVPGMVGRVGTLLGDAGVNIANMTLSRSAAGSDAMMAFTLDDDLPAPILATLATLPGVLAPPLFVRLS